MNVPPWAKPTDKENPKTSVPDLLDFFCSQKRPVPVTTQEFREFWFSLTEKEKDEYKSMDLGGR